MSQAVLACTGIQTQPHACWMVTSHTDETVSSSADIVLLLLADKIATTAKQDMSADF